MSTISVLAFSSEEATTPGSDYSFDSQNAFANHDWALQVESPVNKWVNIRKPYSVVYTPENAEPVPIFSYARQSILKIHIATAKNTNLLRDMTKALREVPFDTSHDHWIDAALTSLQKKNIVPPFSIEKFHQFVIDSLAKLPSATFRRMSFGTTELDYLSMMGNSAEVKKMLDPIHGPGRTTTRTGPIASFCKSTDRHVGHWTDHDFAEI
jgi:hypothetical protein